MADTCVTCRFWDRYEGSLSTDLGDCRFNPPTINDAIVRWSLPGGQCGNPFDELELTLYPASAFAITHQTSWCGRFEQLRSELSS